MKEKAINYRQEIESLKTYSGVQMWVASPLFWTGDQNRKDGKLITSLNEVLDKFEEVSKVIG